jgi:hypothetical protein
MTGAVAWVILGALAAPVHADIDIEWSAPADCPDRAWAVAEVAPLLPEGALEATLARVTIAPHEGAFELIVHVHTGARRSERRVRAPTCLGAASAAVAIIALARGLLCTRTLSDASEAVRPPRYRTRSAPMEAVRHRRDSIETSIDLGDGLRIEVAPRVGDFECRA